MKTKFIVKAAALAAASLCATGAAFAHGGNSGGDDSPGVNVSYNTAISNDIDVNGRVWVDGKIKVKSEAGAAVSTDQMTMGFGDGYGGPDPLFSASVGDNAAENATGNIGLNTAAGMQNVQSNDSAIAKITAMDVFGSAATQSDQGAMGNNLNGFFSTDARVDGNALRHASGNIGLNVAAGAGNAQNNAMAITKSDNTVLAKATATSMQMAGGNSEYGCFENTASLGGNALKGASGNIGANIASGVGNLQHNGLALVVQQ